MKKAYIYILLTAVIFSTMEIAGKMIATEINPTQLNFLRFFIGGLVLLPPSIRAIRKRGLHLGWDDWGYFVLTGVLGIVVSMTFFQLAVVYTMASTVAIIISANPIFTIPFAYLLLNEKLTRITVWSLLISLAGIGFILNPFHIKADVTGIVFAILAAVTFALYGVVGKKRAARYGSLALTCFSFLAGSAVMLGLIGLSHLPVFAQMNAGGVFGLFVSIPLLDGINAHNIGPLIYLGIVNTGLGFLFYFLAMEKTSASTGAVVFFIKPALAPVFAYIALGELIPFNTVIGIAFIIVGSYIKLAGDKPAPQTRPVPGVE